jgi:hypothetical protein
VDRVKRTLDEIERRASMETTRERMGDELVRARARLAPLRAQRSQALAASRRFNEVLAKVYRDPASARRAFHARARQVGAENAAVEMTQHPERFGIIRGAQFGPARSADRVEALQNAGKLEQLGAEHVRSVRQAWAGRKEYRQLRTNVVAHEGKISLLDSELARGTGRAKLQHRLGKQLRALRPHQRNALQRSLPIPHRRMLAAALWAGQAFAREQGHER